MFPVVMPITRGVTFSVTSSGDTAAGNSPVINWDFLQSQSLTSFSRTSNATLFDSTGKLTYAANNLVLNSATLSTQTLTVVSGVNYIVSFYGTGSITLSGAASATINGTGAGTRVYQAITASTASLTLTVSGSVTSAQLEAVTYQTTPSTYNPTTTDPYYGPRYPYAYNGTTWDAQGLLVEAAGTNYLPDSNTFNSWSNLNSSTVTSSAATSPDGTSNGWSITDATAANLNVFQKINTSVTGTSVVFSAHLKRYGTNTVDLYIYKTSVGFARQITVTLTGSGSYVDVVGSGGVTISNVGGGWYRVSVSASGLTSSWDYTYGIYNSNGVYVYGAQVEAGDLSSYIPNLATGTTTRNADTSLAFSAISLPTGLSFSRTSNAMQHDAAGRLTYAPNNLLQQSNNFSDASWNATSATLTTGVSDPVGGTNATTLTATANLSYIYKTVPTVVGTNYLVSYWVKRRTGSGTVQVWSPDTTSKNISPTGSWQQFSFVYAASVANTTVQIRLLTNGDAVDIYGFTFSAVTYETVARPCDQLITTTDPKYGPRYDYDPLTRLPKGLLIEEGRTNVLSYSQNFSNAYWSVSGVSSATDTTLSPDGATLATKLTALTGSGPHGVYVTNGVSTTASQNYAVSVYAKAGTTQFVYVTISSWGSSNYWATGVFNLTGTTDTTATQTGVGSAGGALISTSQQYIGNGWYRLSIVASSSKTDMSAVFGFASAATGNTLDGSGNPSFVGASQTAYFNFIQQELGSFPTSYIPTTSASVARSADIATLTGTALTTLQGSSYSAIAETSGITPSGPNAAILGTNAGGAVIQLYAASGGVLKTLHSSFLSTANTTTWTTTNRSAVAMNASGRSLALNGGTVASDATSLTTNQPITLGSWYGGTEHINGYARKFAVWNVRLPDAKLQQKSTVGAIF